MLSALLYLVFVLAAILLVVIILIQEGKGGGLGDAFGGAGQQTFGVGAKGITKFTAAVAAVFLVTAVAIHLVNKEESSSILDDADLQMPAEVNTGALPGGAAGAPTQPPAGGQ